MGKGIYAALLRTVFPPVTTMLCAELRPGIYGYIWCATGSQQIRLCLLTLLIAPLNMVPLELQRRMVDSAIAGASLDLLLALGALYLLVVLLHAGLRFVRNVYEGVVAEGVIRVLRLRVARDGGKDAAGRGARVSIAALETEQLGAFVGESLSVPLLHIGAFVSVIGYMLALEPLIALYGFAVYLPVVLLVPAIQNAINKYVETRTQLVRELGNDMANEDGTGCVAAGGSKHADTITRIYGTRIRIHMLKGALKLLNFLAGMLGPFGVLVVGGWLVIAGQTELGTVVAFISGYERLQQPARDLLNFYRRWSRMRVQYRLFAEAVA